MQRIIKYSCLLLMLLASNVVISPEKARAQEVSFQVFYDQLSPYGQWVDYPDAGYVWVPNAGYDFSPYQTNGYWAYTDYGWTWVSNYPWGWAPFHYGRWDYDDDYGWYWVPDYEWAPAWVAWSSSPGYYGWAPLRPGIEIDAAITSGYYAPYEHWCYVHAEGLGRRDINRYYAPRSENADHVRNSTMVNRTNIDPRRTVYMGGPAREDVERATNRQIQPLKITPRSTPGQAIASNQVSIYKPVVKPTTTRNPAPAPPKVASIRDLKPLPGRTPNPQRLGAAPPATQQTQQNEQRANPTATSPAMRQREPANIPTAPQNNPAAQPDMRQQRQRQNNPSAVAPQTTTPRQNPQQNAPNAMQRNNPRAAQQPTAPPIQNTQRATPPPTPPNQPAPQQPVPRAQRPQRYTPPAYASPRPYTPPPQQPRTEPPPQRQAPPPQRQAPPPQRQAPPVQRGQTPRPPQQNGKPHQ